MIAITTSNSISDRPRRLGNIAQSLTCLIELSTLLESRSIVPNSGSQAKYFAPCADYHVTYTEAAFEVAFFGALGGLPLEMAYLTCDKLRLSSQLQIRFDWLQSSSFGAIIASWLLDALSGFL